MNDRLLQRIHSIPWHTLQACRGTAAAFPRWFTDLTSADRAMRVRALEDFVEELFHQGTVYEATAFATPLLIDLLPGSPEQDHLLALLTLLATGKPWIDEEDGWLRPRLEREGRDFEEEVARARGDVERIRDALRAGVPVFLGMLDAAGADVRSEAAVLVAQIPEAADIIAPALCRRILIEEETQVRTMLLWALGFLFAQSS